jgi:branched-chain amino acid transport system substrate-binding protein
MGPLAGPDASYGVGLKNGSKMAAQAINKAGGIDGKKIRLQYFNTNCDPTDGATVASDVVSEGDVYGALGDICSSAALAEIPILERGGVTLVSPGASAPTITTFVKNHHIEDWDRTVEEDSAQAPQMVYFATHILHKARLAVLYSNDDYGEGLFQAAQQYIGQHSGASIVASESYTPSETTDFAPQLTGLASSHPDAILMFGYYNDLGVAVGQMPAAGLGAVPLVTDTGAAFPQYMSLGGAATNGTYILDQYNSADSSPVNRAFAKAYAKEFGFQPDDIAAKTYPILFLFKKALEAGATKADLGRRMRAIALASSPIGAIRFTKYGDFIGHSTVVDVVRNKQIVLDTKFSSEMTKSGVY